MAKSASLSALLALFVVHILGNERKASAVPVAVLISAMTLKTLNLAQFLRNARNYNNVLSMASIGMSEIFPPGGGFNP